MGVDGVAAAEVLSIGLEVPGVALGTLVIGCIISIFLIFLFGDSLKEALLDLKII
jgi:hypothetical protein